MRRPRVSGEVSFRFMTHLNKTDAMQIRKATYDDITRLMEIFGCARTIMRESGNLHQWNAGYPSREIVMKDIDQGNCHVLCKDGTIIGTMALIPGPDHTYSEICGSWPDERPYHVIHRIAAAAPGADIAGTFLAWAFGHIGNDGVIRIDTHNDNLIMKHILTSHGFTMCGIIHLDDGSPRDAYICSREQFR